jgi:IS5 family transposase
VLFWVRRNSNTPRRNCVAKVEQLFQVIKARFNHRNVGHHGLEKNTAQLFSLFGFAKLMLTKRYLQHAVESIRLKCGVCSP